MTARLHQLLSCLLALVWAGGAAAQFENASGRELMQQVYERHQQFPYVYEEQSMILIDRDGNRETRTLRRYSRVEADRRVRFLIVFDSPVEIRGVALLAERSPDGTITKSVYLPAMGEAMIHSGSHGESVLGSDFSVENLAGEVLTDYRYRRQRNLVIDQREYFIVDVYPATAEGPGQQPVRRHFIERENHYITRTDYFDNLGRVHKRRTEHDLKPLGSGMWRANMILMEDRILHHRTLLKIDQRVYSHDYVPAELFTREWLLENYPPLQTAGAGEEEDAGTDALPQDESPAQEVVGEGGA